MRIRYALLLVLPLLAACRHGIPVEAYDTAVRPGGAMVTLSRKPPGTAPTTATELIALDTAGVYLLADSLWFLRWRDLQRFSVPKLGVPYHVSKGAVPDVVQRKRLQMVSRFPQGMDAALLARVLEALKQDSVNRGDVSQTSSQDSPAQRLPADASPLERLADSATHMTGLLADREAARAAGYRRIGTDFPGMGEHWLHVPTLLTGQLDPAHPTMLAFAPIQGRPTLIGVGFVLTSEGAALPTWAPGWPDAWHEHSGLLSAESGVGEDRAPVSASSTRVWVLHVWTALANPEGRFYADNWALPFARAGLPAPGGVDADAARAFSLAVGGDAFLRRALVYADTNVLVEQALADARLVADAVRERAVGSGHVQPDDVARLRASWQALAERVTAELGPRASSVFAIQHSAAHTNR